MSRLYAAYSFTCLDSHLALQAWGQVPPQLHSLAGGLTTEIVCDTWMRHCARGLRDGRVCGNRPRSVSLSRWTAASAANGARCPQLLHQADTRGCTYRRRVYGPVQDTAHSAQHHHVCLVRVPHTVPHAR